MSGCLRFDQGYITRADFRTNRSDHSRGYTIIVLIMSLICSGKDVLYRRDNVFWFAEQMEHEYYREVRWVIFFDSRKHFGLMNYDRSFVISKVLAVAS